MIKVYNDGDDLEIGVRYRQYNTAGGFTEFTHNEPDNIKDKNIEKQWVKDELTRTDTLVMLPDYPHIEKLLDYREELRQYDYIIDRPVIPTTESGAEL